MEVVLGLPSTRTHFEQMVSELSIVLPSCHRSEIAEGPIDDGHVDLGRQERGRDAAKRSTVDADLASEFESLAEVVVDLLDIFLEVVRSGFALRTTICSVVPSKYVDAFVKEHFEVKCVAHVHHLLVEHSI